MTCDSFEQRNYDVLLSEYYVLKQKLDSKTEALLILSKELEACRNDGDHWRTTVEQLKSGRYAKNRQNIDNKILTQNLCETKEKNKILQIEIKDLQQKLKDSEGDVKVLREQITRQRLRSNSSGGDDDNNNTACKTRNFSAHDRGRLVEHLESIKMKYALLERDLQSVLDEKEELVTERDAYKHKVDRLNHELNVALKGDDKRVIDIDSILMENRYLQERLKQTQEEKSLYLQTLSKYKNILEKRRNKSALKLGNNGGGSVIITHKQVEQMLQDTSLSKLPATQATIADLRSLSLALFESLNDKNIALSHQKKTNKILGHRLAELEEKLSSTVEFNPEVGALDELGCYFGNDTQEKCVLDDLKCVRQHGLPNHSGDCNGDEDFDKEFERDAIKKVLVEANNNVSDLKLHASESMESLIRSRHPSVVLDDPRSPPPLSPIRHDVFLAAKTGSHFSAPSAKFSPGPDEDMPPSLRKLVQDAMEDLDRRLLQTPVGSHEELE